MLIPLLTFFLRQRVLILIFTAGLSTGGLYAFKTIPIVTFPIELQLRGAPGLTDIRAFSKVGASIITGVFRDDIDIYLARQIVLERVLEGQDLLPPGATLNSCPITPVWGRSVNFIWMDVSTAIGMEAATQVYEGEKRFDLTLRYPESARNSVETIRNILLRTTTGSLVPLGDLARVELREGPALCLIQLVPIRDDDHAQSSLGAHRRHRRTLGDRGVSQRAGLGGIH